jgi:DNA-binding LytR/AlgR family response regulator
MIECIALDDEPLALGLLKDYIQRTSFLHLKATFTDPIRAIEFLQKEKVDLIFLDINMPDIDGLQFMRSLTSPPMVIFTTAYSQHATEGFDLDAVDYLLKPIRYERFLKAVNKAVQQTTANGKPSADIAGSLFVKSEYEIINVDYASIEYIEALDDYVKIFTGGPKPILSRITMKTILDKLPAADFVRVHRSFIVSVRKIKSVRNRRIKIGEKYIPVGDSYAQSFFQLIGESPE